MRVSIALLSIVSAAAAAFARIGDLSTGDYPPIIDTRTAESNAGLLGVLGAVGLVIAVGVVIVRFRTTRMGIAIVIGIVYGAWIGLVMRLAGAKVVGANIGGSGSLILTVPFTVMVAIAEVLLLLRSPIGDEG
jgi:hypothetical protein